MLTKLGAAAGLGGTVLALYPRDMNSLLKYAIIVLLVIVGAVLLSVCADGVGAVCGHTCCTATDRGRRMQRLARKLRSVFRSIVDVALLLLGGATRGIAASISSLASTGALLKVSALRI